MAATFLHDCPAPAKLNLFLHVVGRRPDGYHLLQSVFQLIDRSDTLHFDLRADDRIVRTTDVPGVPEEQDLIVRALRGLQDTRIPMVIAVAGYWIPGFGTAVWLGFMTPLAGEGVWIGLAVGLTVVAALLVDRWRRREGLRLVPGVTT